MLGCVAPCGAVVCLSATVQVGGSVVETRVNTVLNVCYEYIDTSHIDQSCSIVILLKPVCVDNHQHI